MKHLAKLICLVTVLATAALSDAASPSTFSVQTNGRGRPMILVPGLATPGTVWEETVKHFAGNFECHTLSLAGFGGVPANSVSDNAPLLATVRDELATYIQEKRLDRPVVVGHSLGGFLALDLAARYPDLIGPLVVVDSLPFFLGAMRPGATLADARPFAENMRSAVAAMSPEAYAQVIRGGPNGSTMATRPADVEQIIAWGVASDPAVVGQAMTEMYTTDLREELSRIKVPTLALAAWIGYAPYASHETVARTYHEQFSKLPDMRIEITDTARHFIMLDDLAWMTHQIEQFLHLNPAATPDATPSP